MRELGTEILANLTSIIEGTFNQSENLILDTQKNIEILNCFFEVAKTLNWVSNSSLLEIQGEYSRIEEEIREFLPEFQNQLKLSDLERETEKERLAENSSWPIETKEENLSLRGSLLERQKRILEILNEKGKAQVGDFKKIFSEVSKRTLRRDFNYLINQGLVERIGEKNATFYQLKGRT